MSIEQGSLIFSNIEIHTKKLKKKKKDEIADLHFVLNVSLFGPFNNLLLQIGSYLER